MINSLPRTTTPAAVSPLQSAPGQNSRISPPLDTPSTSQSTSTTATIPRSNPSPVGQSTGENDTALQGATPQPSEALNQAFSVLSGLNDGDISGQDIAAFKQVVGGLDALPEGERQAFLSNLGENIRSMMSGSGDPAAVLAILNQSPLKGMLPQKSEIANQANSNPVNELSAVPGSSVSVKTANPVSSVETEPKQDKNALEQVNVALKEIFGTEMSPETVQSLVDSFGDSASALLEVITNDTFKEMANSFLSSGLQKKDFPPDKILGLIQGVNQLVHGAGPEASTYMAVKSRMEAVVQILGSLPEDMTKSAAKKLDVQLQKIAPDLFKHVSLDLDDLPVIKLEVHCQSDGLRKGEKEGEGVKFSISIDTDKLRVSEMMVEAGKYLTESEQEFKDAVIDSAKGLVEEDEDDDDGPQKAHSGDSVLVGRVKYATADEAIEPPDGYTRDGIVGYHDSMPVSDLPDFAKDAIEDYAKKFNLDVNSLKAHVDIGFDSEGTMRLKITLEGKEGLPVLNPRTGEKEDVFEQLSLEVDFNAGNLAAQKAKEWAWETGKQVLMKVIPGTQLIQAAQLGWEIGRAIGQITLSDGGTIDDALQIVMKDAMLGAEGKGNISAAELESRLSRGISEIDRKIDSIKSKLEADGLSREKNPEVFAMLDDTKAAYRMALTAVYKPGTISKESLQQAKAAVSALKESGFDPHQARIMDNLIDLSIKTAPSQNELDSKKMANSKGLWESVKSASEPLPNLSLTRSGDINLARFLKVGKAVMDAVNRGEITSGDAKNMLNQLKADMLKYLGTDESKKNMVMGNFDLIVANPAMNIDDHMGDLTSKPIEATAPHTPGLLIGNLELNEGAARQLRF